MSKKKQVLSALFAHCKKTGDYAFDNDLVKQISRQAKFQNPFDVTKVDNLSILPDEIREAGYCVVHLGKGRHQFIRGIDQCLNHNSLPNFVATRNCGRGLSSVLV